MNAREASAGADLSLTEPDLEAWGASFGGGLMPPAVVALRGDLGAGKTTLARAICRGYGVSDDVTSPTFAIVHEYTAARSPVHHVDLYRLGGEGDLENIGWDDLLRAGGLLLVEWPERAGTLLPKARWDIALRVPEGAPGLRCLMLTSPDQAAR